MSSLLGAHMGLEVPENTSDTKPSLESLISELNECHSELTVALQPGNEGLLETIGDTFSKITDVFSRIADFILPDFLRKLRSSEIQVRNVVSKSKKINAYYSASNFEKFSKTLFPTLEGFEGNALEAENELTPVLEAARDNLLSDIRGLISELSRIATAPSADNVIASVSASSKLIEERDKIASTVPAKFINKNRMTDRLPGSVLFGNFLEIEQVGELFKVTGTVFSERESGKLQEAIYGLDDVTKEVAIRVRSGNVTVSKKAIKDLANVIKALTDYLESLSVATYMHIALIGTTDETIKWIRKNLKK